MALDSGDVIRIAMQFVQDSDDLAFLVRHYVATQGTGADEATVLDDIATYIEAVYELNDNVFASTITSEEATLYNYDFANHRFDGIVSQALTGFIGADVNSPLPGGNAALGKLFTTVARRQSRVYFFGQTEGAYANRLIGAGYATSYLDILDDLGDILVSDGVTFKPCTFNLDAASPLYETTALLSDSYALETIGSYQRGRKQGVGI